MLRKVFHLIEQIVLNWTIELRDLLGSIDICYADFRVSKLLFNGFSTSLSLLLSQLASNRVWKLNDQIQLLTQSGIVDSIECIELSSETISQRAVTSGDVVERTVYDCCRVLRDTDGFSITATIVVQIHID